MIFFSRLCLLTIFFSLKDIHGYCQRAMKEINTIAIRVKRPLPLYNVDSLQCKIQISYPSITTATTVVAKMAYTAPEENFDFKEHNANNEPGIFSVPTHFSLKKYLFYVGQQGQQFSCAAWVAAQMFSATENINNGKINPSASYMLSEASTCKDDFYSPFFIYNYLKKYDPDPADNPNNPCTNGVKLYSALEMPITLGVPKYRDCILPLCTMDATPYVEVAKPNRFKSIRINNGLYPNTSTFQYYLANKKPIAIDIWVGEDFVTKGFGNGYWNEKRPYKITYPEKVGLKRHALLCIGYSEDKHAFEMLNSFGPEWGVNGIVLVDYDYLFNNYQRRNLVAQAFVLEDNPQMQAGAREFSRSLTAAKSAMPVVTRLKPDISNRIIAPEFTEKGKEVKVYKLGVICEKIDADMQSVKLILKPHNAPPTRIHLTMELAGDGSLVYEYEKNETKYFIQLLEVKQFPKKAIVAIWAYHASNSKK